MARAGDWSCPNCGDWQFARNATCRRCGTAKSGGAPAGSSSTDSWWGSWGSWGDKKKSEPDGVAGRSGDWTCPGCGDHVFASRSSCRRCGAAKPGEGGAGASSSSTGSPAADVAAVQAAGGRPGDWICPGCQGLVFASKDHCRKCNLPKPTAAAASAPAAAAGHSCDADAAVLAAGGKPGDWMCPGCQGLVFASRDRCRKCGSQKPQAAPSAPSSAAAPYPPTSSSAARPGDWLCPKCGDVQFARNAACRSCGEARPQWLGSSMGLAPPRYWKPMPAGGPAWALVPVESSELDALWIGMVPGGSFGGRDERTPGSYSGMQPHAAWRLQHSGLWGKYAMERENMRNIELKSLTAAGIKLPSPNLRPAYVNMMKKLPAELDESVNEVYLSHGSKPEILLAILSGGLNERYSGGLFGNGTYLAEDVAKNNQYCTPDVKRGAHPELHKLLFDDTGVDHPGNLFYVIFCRVLLGHRVRTLDGNEDLDNLGESVWSSRNRELSVVKGSSPPVLHHCLIAETGAKIKRFREIVVYHGDRIYPEYLVAYLRS